MQGPNYLDLAKVTADAHLNGHEYPQLPKSTRTGAANRARTFIGQRLINIGERLVPQPRELQLKVSTGPPCP
jgi:hypothetical protein